MYERYVDNGTHLSLLYVSSEALLFWCPLFRRNKNILRTLLDRPRSIEIVQSKYTKCKLVLIFKTICTLWFDRVMGILDQVPQFIG